MIIDELYIHQVRNLNSFRLKAHANVNWIFGPNGSGKTSILESIYILSTAHSFRTREVAPLIHHDCEAFSVQADLVDGQKISIQKSLHAVPQLRINHQPCLTTSALARLIPAQIFYQDIFQIIDSGPSVRREVLDWGLFHVKPAFFPLWKDYKRVLKQRNALLRQKAKATDFLPWDLQLSELSEALHLLRTEYFSELLNELEQIRDVLNLPSCTFSYYKGWDRKNSGLSLTEILKDQFESDIRQHYTHSGAHQADITIKVNQHKAKHELSRGQQKMILFALKCAQAKMLAKPCVYLIDDITAELDKQYIQQILNFIASLKGQIFITATDQHQMLANECSQVKVFNLQAGNLL